MLSKLHWVKYVMRLPKSSEFGFCAVNFDKRLDELEDKQASVSGG